MTTEINFNQSIDRLKESFLYAAAQSGNTEDCESLLAIGADINWRNHAGDTPLLAACKRGHYETIEILLVHGADVNLIGNDSLSPLHICCLRGDYSSLNILLTANPNLFLKTKEGKTGLQLAEMKGHENICYRLSQLMNHSNPTSTSGRSLSTRSGNESHERLSSRQNQSRQLPSLLIDSNPQNNSPLSPNLSDSSHGNGYLAPAAAAALSRQNNSNQSQSRSQKSAIVPPVPLRHSSTSHSASPLPSTTSYVLMGQHIAANHDEGSIALRRLLDQEIKEKKALEMKIKRLEEEVMDLGTLNATMADQLNEMQTENNELTNQLAHFSGATVEKFTTIKECELLENKLKLILQKIEEKKIQIRSKESNPGNEYRLCVICQERDKSVVLFPCRHMCLCEECSSHEELESCPLCRRTIVQRISVFS